MSVDDSIMENLHDMTIRKARHFVAGTRFQMPDDDTIWRFKQLPLIGPTIIGEVLQYNPQEVYVTGFDFYVNGISWAEGYAGKVKRTGGHTYEENAYWMRQRIDDGSIKVDKDLDKIITSIVDKEYTYDMDDMYRQGLRMMRAKHKK